MLSLTALQPNNNEFFISIPPLKEAQNPEMACSSQETHPPKLLSWYAAIYILRGKINEIYAASQKDMYEWEKRVFALNQQLVECNDLIKATHHIDEFLKAESVLEENRNLFFRNGNMTINFSGQVLLLSQVFEVARTINDLRMFPIVHNGLLMTVKRLSLASFNFRVSSWNPHQEPIHLKETLSKYGPMLVFGRFGRQFYEQEPFQLNEKFLDHQLLGWKKEGKRRNDDLIETVILVGASVFKNTSRIYFVDPKDTEDSLQARKIYAISYHNLMTHIFTEESHLFSSIKNNDFDYIPRIPPELFGKANIPDMMANPLNYPGIYYNKLCKSNYGYHSNDISLNINEPEATPHAGSSS